MILFPETWTLENIREEYAEKRMALSTMIHYFDNSFGYEEFEKIKDRMPWIAEFEIRRELRRELRRESKYAQRVNVKEGGNGFTCKCI